MRPRLIAVAALAGAFVVGLVAGGTLNGPGPAARGQRTPTVGADGARSSPVPGSVQERDRTEQGARESSTTPPAPMNCGCAYPRRGRSVRRDLPRHGPCIT